MNYTIKELDDRVSAVIKDFEDHHATQNQHLEFYEKSAFYNRQASDDLQSRAMAANLLKVFADKNVHYTSAFPKFKRPYKTATPESRKNASAVEKAIYGTWRHNRGEVLQREWSQDATLMTEAVATTEPILLDGMLTGVAIERYDPRFCFWEYGDNNGDKLSAFYAMKPMTKEEIKKRWKVEPNHSGINDILGELNDGNSFVDIDGKERFFVIWRWDEKTKVCWVGDKYIQAPYEHHLGFIPVDRCVPFPKPTDTNRFGYFFLDPLLQPQAEYNETLRAKANFIRKMGNPLLWVRGLIGDQLDEIKRAQQQSGGAISFKNQGEAGFLTPPETRVFDEYLDRLWQTMKDIAGFPTATFGESVGANTSGEALGMYFQPTSQAIESQWIAWRHFYQSINEKMLRIFENFGIPGQPFQFENAVFTPEMVEQYYETIIITPSATPRDDSADKRLAMELINSGAVPRVVGYEMMGILDPEDTLELLGQENSDPRIHPEVVSQLAGAAQNINPEDPNSVQMDKAGVESMLNQYRQ